MPHETMGELVGYPFWVRDRVLAAVASLTESEFQSDATITTRDLRATLAHQLENEWAWRIRLTEGSFPAGDVLPTDYPTLDALVGRWHREEMAWRAWLDSLSEADLATRPSGGQDPLALWRYLVYVVTHGLQQFSEAAVLLTRLGRLPGELGYLAYCSSLNEPAAGSIPA